MSIHTHNSDSTVDLLTLIQKNVGLNIVTSSALQFSSHSHGPLEYEIQEDNIPSDCIMWTKMIVLICRSDPEFLDECNSVFFVFRQSVANFFLQLPTREDNDSNVIVLIC